MIKDVEALISEARDVLNKAEENHMRVIADIACLCKRALQKGNKIIIFGNGGSASDSQHIVCEFVGRFKTERRAYPAVCLASNVSSLTAIANDFGYNEVFKRQIEALAEKGDIVWGITTSGNSPNVIEALKEARKKKITTVGFTGKDGGKIKEYADYCLIAPSFNTPRIQEFHILAGHIICELAENNI